jgi:hypothetical protein
VWAKAYKRKMQIDWRLYMNSKNWKKIKLNLSDVQYKRSLKLFVKGLISKYDLDIQKGNNRLARQSYD